MFFKIENLAYKGKRTWESFREVYWVGGLVGPLIEEIYLYEGGRVNTASSVALVLDWSEVYLPALVGVSVHKDSSAGVLELVDPLCNLFELSFVLSLKIPGSVGSSESTGVKVQPILFSDGT